jgi:hypothetical protein
MNRYYISGESRPWRDVRMSYAITCGKDRNRMSILTHVSQNTIGMKE